MSLFAVCGGSCCLHAAPKTQAQRPDDEVRIIGKIVHASTVDASGCTCLIAADVCASQVARTPPGSENFGKCRILGRLLRPCRLW